MPFDPTAADTGALPYVTERPTPLPGEIRVQPEDFRVDEVPAYPPSGEGDHLFVHFEKTDLATPEAVRRIAAALEVDARQAGFAGLKDRRAVTTQWASFLFGDVAKLEGAAIDGVRVLDARRHRNKLRTGHLTGNRFELKVRGAPADAADGVRAQLETLAARGLPHYFGPQRFGRDGTNLEKAARWLLEGGRAPRPRFERKLLVSALQSALFNRLLADRVREGSHDGVIDGDLCRKEDTGGLFVCEDLEQDRPRAARFEISATGPMFGAKMRWPEGEALERERAALDAWGIDERVLASFAKAGAGTRRPYRVPLHDPEVQAEPDGLRLRFTLPAGAYATVVLRELLRRPVA